MMRPVPPGEVLQEQLEELNMSASKLAAHLDVPTNRITEILNGARALTADTALRLSRFFGTTPDFWMALQSKYELRKAELEAARPLAKVIPLMPYLYPKPARPARLAPTARSAMSGRALDLIELGATGTIRAKKAKKKASVKSAKKAPRRAKKA